MFNHSKLEDSKLEQSKLILQRSVEVDVACSVEQVYDLWENLENVPRWMPLVKSVRRLRQGERYTLKGLISSASRDLATRKNHNDLGPSSDEELWHWTFGLGFPLLIEWTSRITQRIPLRLIAWDSVSGLSNRGSAEFFPTDCGCRLRLTLAFDTPGGIVGTFLETIGVEHWLEANLAESLNRFQAQIEAEVLRQGVL